MRIFVFWFSFLVSLSASGQSSYDNWLHSKATLQEIRVANFVFSLAVSSANKDVAKGVFLSGCVDHSFSTLVGPPLGKPYGNKIASSQGEEVWSCKVGGGSFGYREGSIIVIYVHQSFGSAYAVSAIADNIQIEFVDINSCDEISGLCGAYLNKSPDAVWIDEGLEAFNFYYNAWPQNTARRQLNSNVDFGADISVMNSVFGVAVTDKLYEEMRAAGQTVDGKVTGRPSLSSAQIANIFSQSLRSQGWKGVVGSRNQNAGLNLCLGVAGSISRVALNDVFLKNGTVGLTPLMANPVQANSTEPSDNSGMVFVDEAGGDEGVLSCLRSVNNLARYGFGATVLPLSFAAQGVKFVAIDGVEPSRDNAKISKYKFWLPSRFLTNKKSTGVVFQGGTLPAAGTDFLKAFVDAAGSVDTLAEVGFPAMAGFFALPWALRHTWAVGPDCAEYGGLYPAMGDLMPPSYGGYADYLCSRYQRETGSKLPKFYK